jgi:hypothetical protein
MLATQKGMEQTHRRRGETTPLQQNATEFVFTTALVGRRLILGRNGKRRSNVQTKWVCHR